MTQKQHYVPELLAPAGNMERFLAAIRFGADAVYVGAESMSLRNFADNFTLDELKRAAEHAHERGRRVYVACNAFARDRDMKALPALIRGIEDTGADALIVNDPGVIRVARNTLKRMPIHLSTQANTLNTDSALFWHENGVKRIILARELALAEIADIRRNTPETLELEMFVHGAMCVSYSGRCLLSNYVAGRDSNKGECAQPCRWTYELRERNKDGEYLTIEQDEVGTFILNSRDMNLLANLADVIGTGVCSLKIEGRMKSLAYVAGVVNAYRMALDAFEKNGRVPSELEATLKAELDRVSHRPYTTGFALGNPGANGQAPKSADYVSDADIAGVVLDYDEEKRIAKISQRNRFFDGDALSILAPGDVERCFTVEGIRDEEGNPQGSTPHPKQTLYIGCAERVAKDDIIRKIRQDRQD